MTRKLVVVLSTLFTVRGGIPRFNQMLCLALDRLAPELDLDVAVLSQDDSLEDYRASGSPWNHIRFIPGGGQLGLSLATMKLCLRERPDWMLIGLLGMTPLGVAAMPLLRRGFGFVAHGYECWDEIPLSRPKFSRRLSARCARFVFSVSNYTRDSLARSVGIPRERIVLLPNTLAPGFESLPADGAGLSPVGPPEFLTVSRLWVEDSMKGVDHSLEVFARVLQRHPTVRYRIVGKGSDKSRLVQLAHSLGIADSVTFEEDLSDEELADRYRCCSVFVLPSGQEGFGIVFLEAMRFSRPCIGGREGGTPDVVDDGETGILVPYGDRSALEQAISRFIEDPELGPRMGRAGRRRLEENFLFQRYEQRLAEHLRRLFSTP